MSDARSLATAVCAWKGHVTPAADVRSVAGPLYLGLDVPDDRRVPPWRLARCLRCDGWIAVPMPADPRAEHLPPADQLDMPRRGDELRSAVILRLIAVERGLHSLIFAVVAVLAILLRSDLSGVQSWVRRLLQRLTSGTSGTGNAFGGSLFLKEGNRLLHLRTSTLNAVILIALAYFVVEGVEAVFLWREKRWAEYLTAVATVGLVPYEVYELNKGVSVLKVSALVVNLAVLVYLVWSKELFGLGRLRHRQPGHEQPDPARVFALPIPDPEVTSHGADLSPTRAPDLEGGALT